MTSSPEPEVEKKTPPTGGRVLAVFLLGAIALVGFLALADEVQEGSTHEFDTKILRMLRRADSVETPIGPAWLGDVARDVTALGGVFALTLMTAAVAGWLFIARKRAAMILVIFTCVGGLAISSGLKQVFARPRPDVVPHLHGVYTKSFPSGHSMLSAVVYLSLGSFLSRLVAEKREKNYFLGISLLLPVLVGLSRIYLGVHYPTDVLAGWTAGLVWAEICWFATRALQRRGLIENDRVEE